MRTVVRIFVRMALVSVLMSIGFAAGFLLGRQTGFLTGSEWAMAQAAIVAREAGRSMPVTFREGRMRIVVRQPEDLYRRARQRAALETAGELVTPSNMAAVQIAPAESEEQGGAPTRDD